MWTPPPNNKRSSTDLDEMIGRRISLFRKTKELSLQELGGKINLSYQQIQKYESATNRISASRLYVIAKTLNAHISDFFPEEFLHDRFMDDIYGLEAESIKFLMHLLQSSKEDQLALTSPVLELLHMNSDLFLELLTLLSSQEPIEQHQTLQDIIHKITEIDA